MVIKFLRLGAWLLVISGLVFAVGVFLTHSPQSPWYVARWEQVGSGFERLEYISEDDTDILLYAFQPSDMTLRIENSLEPQRVKAWSQSLTGEHLLVNGFYFLDSNAPAGLLISDGQAVHEQTFDFDKSGIVQLAPSFKIIDTDKASFNAQEVLEAGQSYPLLLKQGRGAVKTDSGLRARRTFIGTDESGKVYVGLVWRDDISLYALMQDLLEMDIDWYNVMNLDGGPSSGLNIETDSFTESFDSAAAVPNVIVIQPKNEP
jgi:hypothetical protein